MSRRRTPRAARDYPRTARLNHLIRDIAADTLERIDDERLGLITIQSVEVDAELERAAVYYVQSGEGPADAAEFDEALAAASRAIRRDVGRQAHVRRTPRIEFIEDGVVEAASRVEDILRGLREEQ